ncbi:hypothetical protein [Vibrio astriarenae]|uniref:hypothetical protein n=1 Tax=Vibrio astriarenae TaxID=1481923 RepID=UPI0037366094
MKIALSSLALLASVASVFSASQVHASDAINDYVLGARFSNNASVNNDVFNQFGVNFMQLTGKGNYGFAANVDYLNNTQNTQLTENATSESTDFYSLTVSVGPVYGVTKDFYVSPKIGLNISKKEEREYKGMTVTSESTTSKQTPIYGIDFHWVSGHIVSGIGFHSVESFGDRAVQTSASIGYKF